MSDGWNDGHWVGLGGLVAALATGAVAVYSAVRAARREAKKDEIDNLQAIIDRQDKQLVLREAEAKELREFLAWAQEDHALCQAEQGELYGWMRSSDAWQRRASAALRAKGSDIGEPEPLPPKPERRSRIDFARRSAEQTAKAVEAAEARLGAQGGAGTGQGATP